MNYLIKESEISQEKSPAIILIHGFGSNAQDLFSFVNFLPKKYTIISVEAPYSLGNGGFAWYGIELYPELWFDENQAKLSQQRILNFIDYATEKYHLDSEKILLFGFSQGAILSLSLALSYPEKVKKIAAFSGYFEEKLCLENYKENDFSCSKFFISHGIFDQVVPYAWAEKTPNILKSLNIDFIFEEFASAHTISTQNFQSFLEWEKLNNF